MMTLMIERSNRGKDPRAHATSRLYLNDFTSSEKKKIKKVSPQSHEYKAEKCLKR